MISGTKGMVVGRVVKIRPHPGGDFIWLADLDIGTGDELQIVWGGVPVVDEGDLVPVARPGAWLPIPKGKRGRYKIRRRHYRGEQSQGMLCSLAELGWDPSVTDRVAVLDGSVGLEPGDSLDDIGDRWPLILKPAKKADSGVPLGRNLGSDRIAQRAGKHHLNAQITGAPDRVVRSGRGGRWLRRLP